MNYITEAFSSISLLEFILTLGVANFVGIAMYHLVKKRYGEAYKEGKALFREIYKEMRKK